MELKKGLCFILLALSVFSIEGCDKYSRYEILTFFFTGVPHPDEQSEPLIMKKETFSKDDKDEDIQVVLVSPSHGPFETKQCFLCHQLNTSAPLMGNIREKAPKPARFDSALPGRLLAPVNQLCIECHVTKSKQSAYSNNLWIHGPVSVGACTICHSPHSSSSSYMLHNDCSICHTSELISQSDNHIEGKDCSSCHNAHLGKDRFLLKKDFEEVF